MIFICSYSNLSFLGNPLQIVATISIPHFGCWQFQSGRRIAAEIMALEILIGCLWPFLILIVGENKKYIYGF